MASLKIAVLGAGSFVFGPSLLSQANLENDLGETEIALMDTDAEALNLIAGVGRRMVREARKPIRISTHTERDTALEGADYVISAAAVQGRERYEMDYDIIQRYIPGHLVTEFGGVAGISYSLRQIALVMSITDDMKYYCPDAWLLNIANPLPRVCQAAEENGIRTVGFCSVALTAYNKLWQLLRGGSALKYPFTEAIKLWQMTTAGVNHLSWVLELSDRRTGENLLPTIPQQITQGAHIGQPQTEAMCLETGYFLAADDDHIQGFFPSIQPIQAAHMPFHGDDQERRSRLQLLRDIATDDEDWHCLLNRVSWERPIDLIAARETGTAMDFGALNLRNDGQMPDLPQGVFVETPCHVSAEGSLHPTTIRLPESVAALTQRAAQLNDTIVHAAMQCSRELVHRAVELDPTIEDKPAGRQAIDACIRAHADLLPHYA
ncbi:MAG: hypothetical protein K8J31_28475 [Anaerolineae bacterium]|nr:hypothetical protein [Anaerolineae bacterium]